MKILIADDEHMICEWLAFCIAQNHACELVGTANNGREALEMYMETQPDLVLTDIKMPVMDGLALLHAIRNVSAETQVVILTAFSDFDLARQALRDGANEYVLKTELQNQSFQELLQRMSKNSKVRNDGNEDRIYTAQSYANIRNIMLQQTALTDDQLATLSKCGVRWRNSGLFALALWKQHLALGEICFPQDQAARHVAGFDYTDRIYVVVGNLPRTLSEAEQKKQLAKYAESMLALNNCMVGVSPLTGHLRNIPTVILEAVYALARGFYEEVPALYLPVAALPEIKKNIAEWETEFKTLRNSLHKIKPEERTLAIEKILRKTTAQNAADIELFTDLAADMLDALYFCATESGSHPCAPDEYKTKLRQSISMRTSARFMVEYAQSCFASCAPQAKPKSKAVSLAVEYLRKNFDKPLSLEQVAELVYLNPEYFSRIFK